MAASSLLSTDEVPSRERAPVWRDWVWRIRRHVAQHLHDPALSIEAIAQALRCSKRHPHNAFAGDDDTLTGYILQQRLATCIRDLQDPANAACSITDITLASGFSNLSHFSRVFREHTGGSPSEFRQRARRGA